MMMYHGQGDLMPESQRVADEEPMREQLATIEEQQQYTDLVSRGMMMLSDTRERPKGQEGVAGGFGAEMLNSLRSDKLPLEQTFGTSLGNMMLLLWQNAAQQGYEYEPQVVLGALDELSKLYYLLAKEAGAIASGPPSLEEGGTDISDDMADPYNFAMEDDLMSRQMADDRFITLEPSAAAAPESPDTPAPEQGEAIDYDFSLEELEFLEDAQVNATQYLGMMLSKTGMLNHDAWREYAQSQVSNEVRRGETEVPMEELQRAYLGEA